MNPKFSKTHGVGRERIVRKGSVGEERKRQISPKNVQINE